VYGQTKAAGDQITATLPAHYTIRTSWVIGDGHNFVTTMASLARRGIRPTVVADQIGRLTFTDTLARGIRHLIDTHAPYGTYNLTNTGPEHSWADIAKTVYAALGASPDDVTPTTTADYYHGKTGIAPRPPPQHPRPQPKSRTPVSSPENADQALERYLVKLARESA
jgi:dTDP-4-dehydrorhamnose 3,5-epimerase/reductase